MKNSKLLRLSTISNAKKTLIEFYKQQFILECKKNGMRCSGKNIQDMINKITIVESDDIFAINIDGGNYKDYFNNGDFPISVTWIFDEEGNPIYIEHSIINSERIVLSDNNNFYIFTEQYSNESKNYKTVHFNYNPNKRVLNFNRLEGFSIKTNELELLPNSNKLAVFRINSIEGNRYLIYNQDTMKEVLTCSDISDTYEDYPNVVMDKYILVTKTIRYEGLTSIVEFFIDEDGNIVSQIFDCERGLIHQNNDDMNAIFNKIREYLISEHAAKQVLKVKVRAIKENTKIEQ